VAVVLRILFFALNFSVAVLYFVGSMTYIVLPFFGGGSFGAFVGGVFGIVPSGLMALGEWWAYYRRKQSVEYALGVIALVLSALVVFGVVANVAEAWSKGSLPDWFPWFIAVGSLIAVYFALCGLFRLGVLPRRRTQNSGLTDRST
jgi:hypothetical protein